MNMFLFLFLLTSLSHLSKTSSSLLQCPSSFQCNNSSFMYPFYNSSTDSQCGFFKLSCSTKSPIIQLQNGEILEIRKKISSNSLLVHNKIFSEILKPHKCDVISRLALRKPSKQLSFAKKQTKITLFKCLKASSLLDHTYDRLECNDHFLYYNMSVKVPINDTPSNCVVLELPYNQTTHNSTDLYTSISAEFLITFHNLECHKCQEGHGQCQVFDQKLLCVKAKDKDNRKLIIIAVLVGSALIFAFATTIFFIRRTYKRKAFTYFSSKDESRDLEDASVYFGVSVFSYSELQDATNHFDASQELGDGGFGTVYYGKLRDGREVAVKRLYEHNYKRVQQFMNEVEILTRLRHKNLVSLYGCTSRKSRELLLVYEYIANGTVADHLHGDRTQPSPLTWQNRMKIAIETASALVYLHASDIIHRDVKTNNILLDNNFCVKVADFGLSRLLPNDVTHVSTAPQGTPGYVDPEYHQCYQLTDKSDVYSFGVVLIELISSMPAIDISRSRDEISLANMAINRIQKCALDELIDPYLGSDPDTERMTTSVAELAFRCLQFDSDTRPTMIEVLEVLKGIQVEKSMEDVDDIEELNSSKAEMRPPSPENEGTELLKGPITASPVSVTTKWHSTSSESTTPNISVLS